MLNVKKISITIIVTFTLFCYGQNVFDVIKADFDSGYITLSQKCFYYSYSIYCHDSLPQKYLDCIQDTGNLEFFIVPYLVEVRNDMSYLSYEDSLYLHSILFERPDGEYDPVTPTFRYSDQNILIWVR